MSFYGIAGLLLATYLWLTINWNVGAGYNEFNKEEGIFRVFRYGFPGKNRRVNLLTDLKDVTAVRVEISDGINPRRVVYVKCKGKGDIPLTRIGQPLTLAEVERQAAELAKFLQVPIEGL
jgi:ribosomal protein S28E/S33